MLLKNYFGLIETVKKKKNLYNWSKETEVHNVYKTRTNSLDRLIVCFGKIINRN